MLPGGVAVKSVQFESASFQETGTVRKQCQAFFTLRFALRIQEEISRIPRSTCYVGP